VLVAWETVTPGVRAGTLKFEFKDYKVAGDFDVRYFYGDEVDGGGYQCSLRAGSPVDTHCLLKARGTSSTIQVLAVADKGTGWHPPLPGLENFCDGARGVCS